MNIYGFSLTFTNLCVGMIRSLKRWTIRSYQAVFLDNWRFRFSMSFCFLSTIRSLSSCCLSRSIFCWVWLIASGPSKIMPWVNSWWSRCATMSRSWRINESSPLDRGSFGIGVDGVEVGGSFASDSSLLEFLYQVLKQCIGWWCSYEWCHMR